MNLMCQGIQYLFSLQALIAEREGYAADDQVVLLGGKPLENEGLLTNLCQDMATLDVDIRLLGGEILSSLQNNLEWLMIEKWVNLLFEILIRLSRANCFVALLKIDS